MTENWSEELRVSCTQTNSGGYWYALRVGDEEVVGLASFAYLSKREASRLLVRRLTLTQAGIGV